MKNILFVVDEKKIGGVNILLEDILNNVDFKNSKIDLLILHNNGDRFINLPKDITIIYGNKAFNVVDLSIKYLLNNRLYLKAIKKVYISLLIKTGLIKYYIKINRKKMKLIKYDIEIAFKSGFCSLFTAYGNSTKKINWVHEDYSKNDHTQKYKKEFSRCFKMFDRIIAVSNEANKSFKNIYGFSPMLRTIENYIDVDRIKKMSNQELEDQGNLFNQNTNFITVARLSKEKRIDRILEATEKLVYQDKITNFKVIIVGDGIEANNLFNIASIKNINEYITFIGQKSNPYNYMRQADCFILSSETESFGISRIESLILKVPIITTDVPYTNEILEDNKYGIKVNNSAQGIYEGMKQILTNKRILLDLKENCKDFKYERNKNIIKKITEEIL